MNPHDHARIRTVTASTLGDALRVACAEVGLVERDVPVDGKWYRTNVDGDPRGRGDGSIKLFADGEGGICKNWKGETICFFVDDGHSLTEAERLDRERKRFETIIRVKQEQARQYAEAETKAVRRWNVAAPAPGTHPYLVSKGIRSHGLRVRNGTLLVPVYRDGQLRSLQYIGASGNKRFLLGGAVSGGCFCIGELDGASTVCIVEGYATGASVFEATGHPVVVAFDCGNMGPVAQSLRTRFPDSRLVLCADDDANTPGNPGLSGATAAARAVGGALAVPKFPDPRDPSHTDMNDLVSVCGMDAVRKVVVGAETPVRVLPPPSMPMAVARRFITEKHETAAGRTLINHRGDFFRWNGTCWPESDKLDVRRDAYGFVERAISIGAKGDLQPFAPTARKVNDLIDALRACVGIASENEPPVWLDGRANPPAGELIAMQNGLLHLPTRTVLPHTPRFFAHHALAFPFVAEAPEPVLWMKFLRQLWPSDHASIDALQELFGYVIGGDTRQQKIFLLVGPRRGGKGVIGRVLTGILGRHNVAAPTLAGLSTNFGLAPLIGKPLALISDARLSAKSDAKVVVERLLSISGEDSLTIDRKYRETWTGRLPSRFLILTNELPQLVDASGALSSRFIMLVGSTSFLGREDPGLTDKLLTEAPSILKWALEGLDRLNSRGYFVMPESGRDAVRQLEDLAAPVAAFIRERCMVRPDTSVLVDDLWAAWKTWCEGQGRGHGTKAVFGRDLHAAFPAVRNTRPRDGAGRQHRYEGISIATTLDNCYDRHDHYDQSPAAGHGGHGGHGNSPMYSLQNDSNPDAEPTDEDGEVF